MITSPPYVNAVIFEDRVTGTTVDALTTILDFDTRNVKMLSLSLKNMGAASLVIRITSRTKVNGTLDTIDVNDVTITAGSTFRFFSSKFLAETIFAVRSLGAGVPTTYAVEYTGSKGLW